MKTIVTLVGEIEMGFRWSAIRSQKSETGQTSVEYVAITSVALILAVGVTWSILSGALSSALAPIFDKLSALLIF